jgi:hypothetical protein
MVVAGGSAATTMTAVRALHADERDTSCRVALVANTDDGTTRRLAAELRVLGFRVSRVLGPHARGETALVDTARQLGVDGAVEVEADDVLVYVREASGRTLIEHAGAPGDSTTTIPRATELLRTRLLPAPASHASVLPPALVAEKPPPVMVAPPPSSANVDVHPVPPPSSSGPSLPHQNPPKADETRSPAWRAREPTAGIWLGPSIVYSGGAAGSAGYAAGGGFLRVLGPLRIEVMVGRSLTSSTVTATEGQTSVDAWLAAVGARAHGHLGRIGASAGLGLGGVWLQLKGAARPPFVSGHDDILTLWPYAVFGLDASLSRIIALRLDGHAGVSVPRATIAFAGERVTDWGAPIVSGTLAVEVQFD